MQLDGFFETLIGDPVTTAGNTGACSRRQADQAAEREAAGSHWQDGGRVFTTATGTPLGARHIRRMFQDVCERAGLGRD